MSDPREQAIEIAMKVIADEGDDWEAWSVAQTVDKTMKVLEAAGWRPPEPAEPEAIQRARDWLDFGPTHAVTMAPSVAQRLAEAHTIIESFVAAVPVSAPEAGETP